MQFQISKIIDRLIHIKLHLGIHYKFYTDIYRKSLLVLVRALMCYKCLKVLKLSVLVPINSKLIGAREIILYFIRNEKE